MAMHDEVFHTIFLKLVWQEYTIYIDIYIYIRGMRIVIEKTWISLEKLSQAC